MRVLVACEFSGVVRAAFRARNHDAWSCDLVPAEDAQDHHLLGDVRQWLLGDWDLMIAHPPCTYLAASGARWWAVREAEQDAALDFVCDLLNAPIARICLENPVGAISTRIEPPSQIIQPWQFGHGETKTTCLWLQNLPQLQPTDVVDGRVQRIHNMSQSPTRARDRSRTYTGIANAMAERWG